MFPPSVLTLTLNRSRDYQRLLTVIYAVALFMLWQAAWSWLLSLFTALLLLACAYVTIQDGKPHTTCQQWVWQHQQWLVYEQHGVVSAYAYARIRYDVGLFMRIDLCAKTHTRRFVLFNDQITARQRRLLYLLQLSHTPC